MKQGPSTFLDKIRSLDRQSNVLDEFAVRTVSAKVNTRIIRTRRGNQTMLERRRM